MTQSANLTPAIIQIEPQKMQSVLRRINKSALRLLEPLTPEETYKSITEEAIKLVRADYGSIFLEENGSLRKVYSSDPIIFQIRTRAKGYIYEAFKKRRSFVVDATQIGKVHPTIRKLGVKSNIYISLSHKKQAVGIIVVHSIKKAFFTKDELEILEFFGSLASLAVKKTQAFEQARDALEVRDQFISLASHELRTPLTTITGYIQMLYSKLSGSNSAESRWIEQLSYESQRLTNLVKELLDINKIKAGKLEYFLKECNLTEIIARAIKDVNFTHPNREIVLENKVKKNKDILVGDFDKLVQVFVNVLDNAAKYSPEESVIKIILREEDHNFKIDIMDKGIGLLEKELPRVFNDFYKGIDNQKEGLGIGLLLCKHIVDSHNGTIELFSIKNRGTMVKVILPKGKK